MTGSLFHNVVLAFALTATMTLVSPTLSAQEQEIEDLLACDRIKNSDDKVACFIAAAEVLKRMRADQNGSEATSAQPQTSQTPARSSEFGLDQKQIRERDAQTNPRLSKVPKEQIFQFSQTWRDAVGKYYFLMENGQIWKEVGGSHMIVPKRSKSIRIKRNILGGYYAYIEGMAGRPGRVARVR